MGSLLRSELFELWCRMSSYSSIILKKSIQTKEKEWNTLGSMWRIVIFYCKEHEEEQKFYYGHFLLVCCFESNDRFWEAHQLQEIENSLLWHRMTLNFVWLQLGSFLCKINYYVNISEIVWFLWHSVDFLFNVW